MKNLLLKTTLAATVSLMLGVANVAYSDDAKTTEVKTTKTHKVKKHSVKKHSCKKCKCKKHHNKKHGKTVKKVETKETTKEEVVQ